MAPSFPSSLVFLGAVSASSPVSESSASRSADYRIGFTPSSDSVATATWNTSFLGSSNTSLVAR